MLAMKAITAEANAVPTMVFDEIDTGISGNCPGDRSISWDIARFRQVICVSHLHQIAAMASSQSGGGEAGKRWPHQHRHQTSA